jgi:DNA helicase-2/ATP-dependent DNA helicase PcrA
MYTKELYTRKEGGSLPQLVATENENMQSRFVVQKILELREEGVALEDMAVLFRSSFLSFDLEIELARANIPFRKFGGYKFIETSHVKDIIAHLRVLENPRDVVSWNRILLLLEGIGPRTAEKIIDDIQKRRVGLAKDYQEAVTTTTKFWMEYGKYPKNVRSLFDVLKGIASPEMHPADKVAGLLDYYEPVLRVKFDDHPKRRKDLDMFQTITERYSDVPTLLTDLALEPPTESIVDVEAPGKETEYLTLSTIHSAKGLEWRAVVVLYALEGRFPAMRSVGTDEEIEEERRLMYVAITRAKEHVFITYPMNVYDRESGVILTKPSRFLDGISEKILEPWVVE